MIRFDYYPALVIETTAPKVLRPWTMICAMLSQSGVAWSRIVPNSALRVVVPQPGWPKVVLTFLVDSRLFEAILDYPGLPGWFPNKFTRLGTCVCSFGWFQTIQLRTFLKLWEIICPWSWVHDPESRALDSGSWIQDPEARIRILWRQDLGFRIRVHGPEFTILNSGSWAQGLEARILNPQPWTQDLGSWVQDFTAVPTS